MDFSIPPTLRNQRDFCPFKNNFVFINKSFFVSGKGDLVGCDISKHLQASANGSDVVVKSSCDVKALTYCDLKCLNIPGLGMISYKNTLITIFDHKHKIKKLH